MMFYDVSNLDIKMTYIANEGRPEKAWMDDIFVQTKFFADSRAKKYSGNMVSDDLCQEAYLGLWEAIITYDYQKNFDFYRWAQWNISKKLRNFTSESKRFRASKSSTKDALSNYKYDCFLGTEGADLEMKIFYKTLLEEDGFVLTKRERIVVVDNLILGKKLKEIATSLNLSSERIRQIRNCGLQKIRKAVS